MQCSCIKLLDLEETSVRILIQVTLLMLYYKDLRKLQCSCIELLQVLLEETNNNSSELAHGISTELHVHILLKVMKVLNVSGTKTMLNYLLL